MNSMVMFTNGWVSDDMSSTNYFTNREERQQMGTVSGSLDSVLIGWLVGRSLDQRMPLNTNLPTSAVTLPQYTAWFASCVDLETVVLIRPVALEMIADMFS